MGLENFDCKFPSTFKGSACSNGCGWKLPHDYDQPPRRNCKAYKPRLGDVTKRLLDKGSITPAVTRIVKAITLGAKQPESTGCGGCQKRQNWLNRWPAPRWLAALSGFKHIER